MKYCPQCGSELFRPGRYCGSCGNDLRSLEASIEDSEAPADSQVQEQPAVDGAIKPKTSLKLLAAAGITLVVLGVGALAASYSGLFDANSHAVTTAEESLGVAPLAEARPETDGEESQAESAASSKSSTAKDEEVDQETRNRRIAHGLSMFNLIDESSWASEFQDIQAQFPDLKISALMRPNSPDYMVITAFSPQWETATQFVFPVALQSGSEIEVDAIPFSADHPDAAYYAEWNAYLIQDGFVLLEGYERASAPYLEALKDWDGVSFFVAEDIYGAWYSESSPPVELDFFRDGTYRLKNPPSSTVPNGQLFSGDFTFRGNDIDATIDFEGLTYRAEFSGGSGGVFLVLEDVAFAREWEKY